MFKAATVISAQPYSKDAGRRLGSQLVAKLGKTPDACWLFCAPGAELQSLLTGVYESVGTDQIVGCTTDGEVSSAGFSVSSAVLAGIASDQIRFNVASVSRLSINSEQAGVNLARQMPASVRHVQIFSDGLTGNGSAIVRGMTSVLGSQVPISGGAAGDSRKFTQTLQFIGRQVMTDSAVAIGLSGSFPLGTGVRSGWFPAGAPKIATKAQGNVVFELDGEPALTVYRRYFGPYGSQFPAAGVQFPMGIVDYSLRLGEDPILRAPMAIDEALGSVSFAGEVPEGATLCLTTAGSEESLLDAATEAARRALVNLGDGTPAMVFFYSCMARRFLLGDRTSDEIRRIRNAVGNMVPAIGFYTYGEFCPNVKDGDCQLHNETATVTILGLPGTT